MIDGATNEYPCKNLSKTLKLRSLPVRADQQLLVSNFIQISRVNFLKYFHYTTGKYKKIVHFLLLQKWKKKNQWSS